MHAEQIGHHCGQALFGQQLEVQRIDHHRGDARAILHRRADAVGEGRARLRAAGGTPALMGTVLGHHQGLRFGQIKHLAGDMAGGRGGIQRRTATPARRWKMLDRDVGRRHPAQCLAAMAWLAAGRLARRLTQAAGPLRLFQSVAGGRLAAVAAVQPQLALKLRNTGQKHRILRPQFSDDRLIEGNINQIAFRSDGKATRCHPHLDSYSTVARQAGSASNLPGQLPKNFIHSGGERHATQ